jgi:cytochrome bd-type quinol oxidase subunit 2
LSRDDAVCAAGAVVACSAGAGLASLALLGYRRFALVRVTAALAVTAVLWAWGIAQYPHLLLPGLTVGRVAANHANLQATMISMAVGIVLLQPSFAWLFVLFQRGAHPRGPHPRSPQLTPAAREPPTPLVRPSASGRAAGAISPGP